MSSYAYFTNTSFLPSSKYSKQENPIGSQSDNSSKTELDSTVESPTTEEQLSNQSTPLSQKIDQPSLSEQLNSENKNAPDEMLCIAKGDTDDIKSVITTHY
ncbi:MAG: hypothetical protein N0C81_03545 [Candidatus Thiodiazotropha lotti]|nr:hypothetical protein [Candidatus Thiodiazotropha lotti]MCG8004742.1 hypothetical protein [Candidatus Thiodiazotropha lotti]MCG8006706.1 hypothetical protein [Candidatus Thiodiazotropha lotti]MCW4188369.1 hypothetical protein [Candidatus Thiodiazotropha lotti]MCW4194288.1 hypothetical protein [Candidatus Thiodiazotropha lotti]